MDLTPLWDQRQALLAGVETTLVISLSSALLAVLIGLVAVIASKVTFWPVAWSIKSYIQFFRNTPLLIQLFFFYKGLPHFGIILPALFCGILALSLQASAYISEIFRAGLEAVPKEQYDSGLSLGFSKWQTYWAIILPQVFQVVIPPLGNQMTSILKNSSLVAFITVPDLFFVIFSGGAAHFQYLAFFVAGIGLYIVLNMAITAIFSGLEKGYDVIFS